LPAAAACNKFSLGAAQSRRGARDLEV